MTFAPRLANVGLVVLATNNNPKLLNPDFLLHNKIVPDDWVATDVLVTPPFAQTLFSNGVNVQVDEGRVTVQTGSPDSIDWCKVLPEIVDSYLGVLPHIEYRAVGMNFGFISDEPNGIEAESRLINSLMKPGEWSQEFSGLSGVVLELQYRNQQPHLNLRVGAREQITPQGSTINGYAIFANLHHDFSRDEVAERKAFIGALGKNFEDVRTLLNKIPLGQT